MSLSLFRTRWAAIGAAVAVTLGAGGFGLANAALDSGERPVFVAITPCRILDTRAGSAVVTKQTPLGAGEVYTQNAHGNNGLCTNIPTDATALTLNATAIGATTPGTYLTIWPTGAPQPDASSLNPAPGQPPTPNAVITDISPGGQFNIYNYTGTVNLLIDVTGYYIDHNHDDRYYTKDETNNARAAAKFLSIDPLGAHIRGSASIIIGSGANTGIELPNSAAPEQPQFEFGFTVPPDHTPNTPISITLTWHVNQASCTLRLTPNFDAVGRPGQVTRGGAVTSLGTITAPSPADTAITSTFTAQPNGFGLAPGDSVIVGFYRVITATGTPPPCTQPVRVVGIQVVYT